MKEFYVVQKIDIYGEMYFFRDIIAIFECKRDAERYCLERYPASMMYGTWPLVTISKQQVYLKK